MAFMQNLNYCMQQKGYSAYRLAKIIGASNQGVLLWQTGKNTPHPKTRQKIADHFGITLAELDGDELPVLPEKDAEKAPATEGEGIKYTDFELLQAYHDADHRTKEAIRTLLGIKGE